MNSEFMRKCNEHQHFSSIRYAIHCMEDAQMADKILEVSAINPFLGVWTYVTSEYDWELQKRLIDFLDNLLIEDFLTNVQIVGAWSLLGEI